MVYKALEIISFNESVLKKSVAVIGNSQSLFNQNYGAMIDSHDIVIRFNKAAPIYCDYDVSKTHGKKFDFWMFWTIGAFYNRFIQTADASDKIKSLFYSDYPFKIQAAINGHKELTEKYISNTCPIIYFQELRKTIRVKNETLQPSAGLVLLNWLNYCEPKRISVFGMDFKKTPTFSELDKFEQDMKNGIDTRCNHDYDLEQEWFEKNMSHKVILYT